MMNNPVVFDLDLYSRSAIEQAISDYREYANISASFEGEKCTCFFSHCKFDSLTTICEFTNYALMLTIQNRKRL